MRGRTDRGGRRTGLRLGGVRGVALIAALALMVAVLAVFAAIWLSPMP